MKLEKKKKDTTARPKTSSNRITVLPGFLSKGVKAIATKKEEAEENKANENILKEDLHSLFISDNQGNSSLRRSSRISKKNIVNYAEVTPKKRKYPRQKKLTSPKTADPLPTANFEEYFPLLKNTDVGVEEGRRRNSRSLFKKIISSQTLSNSIYYFKSFFSNKDHRCGENFNQNILDKIQINFKVDIIESLRGKIFEEIGKVNDILIGKVDPPSMGSFLKLKHGNMDDVEHQVPEYLFPSRDWQFATPPSQKLNITFYEESAIQPAILCNDGTGRNIYQLKKEMDSNLINHINPNSIEVDSRYMEQIAEFDKENRPLRSFNFNQKKSTDRRTEDFDFNPKFFNHFRERLTTIQMRPKKTVKRLRFADSFNRNQLTLELSKPSTSNVFDPLAMESSELDFTFVNCVNGNSDSGSPRSHFKVAPRNDIFGCLDNPDFFGNCSSNME